MASTSAMRDLYQAVWAFRPPVFFAPSRRIPRRRSSNTKKSSIRIQSARQLHFFATAICSPSVRPSHHAVNSSVHSTSYATRAIYRIRNVLSIGAGRVVGKKPSWAPGFQLIPLFKTSAIGAKLVKGSGMAIISISTRAPGELRLLMHTVVLAGRQSPK